MELLSNPWFVGIVGSVLSGFLVTWISSRFFSRKDAREHAQRVDAANREVLYTLRAGISEDHVPTEQIVESLLRATARRHRVSRADVYTSEQIAEDLIKEIMDSSFLTSQAKQGYCNKLADLTTTKHTELAQAKAELELVAEVTRTRISGQFSQLLGFATTVFALVVVVIDVLELRPSIFLKIIDDLLLAIGIAGVLVLVRRLLMHARSKKQPIDNSPRIEP
jgi:vacuolar-type H+-ATPase subunit I/STV1